MAEDRRNRPDYLSDSYASKDRDPAGDPLAELARLIGQSDPFADTGKAGASTRRPLETPRASDRPAPEWLARPPAPPEENDYDAPAQDRYAPEESYRADAYEEAPYDPPPAHDYRSAPAAFAPDDRYAQAPAAHAPQPAYRAAEDGADYAEHDPAGADPYQNDDRYRVAPPLPGDYEPDSYYAEDGHLPPQGDEGLPVARHRGGILTIAAVLGLALVGTAGAFGYRAFTSGAKAPATPPVIQADATPAKIVPPQAAAANDAQGKPFQDRVGAPAVERVVSREEQPVSLPITPPQAPAPAAAAPAPVMAPPPAPATPTVRPAAAAGEPKRVRTLTIRPDGGAPDTTATATTAAPPSASGRQGAAKSGSAPLAIAPNSEPPARTKVASRGKSASDTVSGGSGAYVVQVSAQKTEAEARSSYQALQQKYPNVLAGRDASVRRADLGDKGVYYRAQIGPFATASQANEFCGNLKAAGGQCIVQKN